MAHSQHNTTATEAALREQVRKPARALSKRRRVSPIKQRKLIEVAIERLVSLLDEIDQDPDDEPSLGSLTSCHPGYDSQEGWSWGSNDDREKTGYATETDDDEPTLGWGAGVNQTGLGHMTCDGDLEPELGWTDMEARYGRYSGGGGGEADTADNEASLGWKNEGSQARLHTSPGDREQECEDEGAEHDGCEPDHDNEGFGQTIHGGAGV
jgi:hypothetical protein